MSKSLGNVIDPLDTIKEYGTDALRFTLATGTTPGQVQINAISSGPCNIRHVLMFIVSYSGCIQLQYYICKFGYFFMRLTSIT